MLSTWYEACFAGMLQATVDLLHLPREPYDVLRDSIMDMI